MYMFTRTARLRPGGLLDSMAWSVKMTEKVNEVTELAASLWTPVFSPALGSLTWVAMVEELASLEGGEAKLMADPAYLALVEEGAQYLADSGVDDSLWQVLYADPEAASTLPQYVNLVGAVLVPGKFARGVEVGVEIAQRATQTTGRATGFSLAETGPYGAVTWSAGADSIEQLQAARQALTSSSEFVEYLDKEAATVYLPGATQAIYRKVA
jgi:hypothetical protein